MVGIGQPILPLYMSLGRFQVQSGTQFLDLEHWNKSSIEQKACDIVLMLVVATLETIILGMLLSIPDPWLSEHVSEGHKTKFCQPLLVFSVNALHGFSHFAATSESDKLMAVIHLYLSAWIIPKCIFCLPKLTFSSQYKDIQ